VLITGAGGSIGSSLAAAVLGGSPRRLVLLDLSESALYESLRRLSFVAGASAVEIVPAIGSVGDARFVSHLFGQHRPELIFHAAAYKHVPLMEQNPFSAIANNSIGTFRLVVAAIDAGVSRLIAISTDKAVNPLSVMGVSKRIAELAVLSHSSKGTEMNVVRLCNVLGSSGSVAAIFQEQAEHGMPLTVTHADAMRYFLAPAEATRAILGAVVSPFWGRVLVPACGEEIQILELAHHIAGRDASIAFTGLRPGDKLREELWSSEEFLEAVLPNGMRVLKSPVPSALEVSVAMERLNAAVDTFDHKEMVCAVAQLVPGYGNPFANEGALFEKTRDSADPSLPAVAQDDNLGERAAVK
jgi:FlaA1/EpsC-like NDP-sugar epimerase